MFGGRPFPDTAAAARLTTGRVSFMRKRIVVGLRLELDLPDLPSLFVTFLAAFSNAAL